MINLRMYILLIFFDRVIWCLVFEIGGRINCLIKYSVVNFCWCIEVRILI